MTTASIGSHNTFLEKELFKSFINNMVALQLAAFHRLDFKNGYSVKVELTDTPGSVARIVFIDDEGDHKAEHFGVGELSQAYEFFAHIVNTYAKSNNTSIISFVDEDE